MLMRCIFCVVVVGLSGCLSIEGKRVYTDSAGNIKTVDIGGMPIVVQRPTKAIFIVTTKEYALSQELVDADGVVVGTEELGKTTEMDVSPEPIMIGPSELYAIDMKRPASGTIDYSIELDKYYPTKIGAKLDDKTLDALNKLAVDLVTNVLPGLGVLEGGGGITKESGAGIVKTPVGVKKSLLIIDLETGAIRQQAL